MRADAGRFRRGRAHLVVGRFGLRGAFVGHFTDGLRASHLRSAGGLGSSVGGGFCHGIFPWGVFW